MGRKEKHDKHGGLETLMRELEKNDTARRAFTILICYLFNDILMNVLSF